MLPPTPKSAWIDFLALLVQLFPESLIYSLDEIALALASIYGDSINYHRVRYAWTRLYDDDATRALVKPVSQKRRHYRFDAAAARCIAKELLHGEMPSNSITDGHTPQFNPASTPRPTPFQNTQN